ncbi:NYN domain-containing protein [Paenibacillus sp. y28]|uniref:NYN domain-containing protein n=1 Tax=Paenibacillus sp. y28 TaxID=3129110 RepID=UPI003017ACE7
MQEFLIVDGYNIIGAWPELNRIKEEESLEAARDKLIEILAEYQAISGRATYLVFDAYKVPGVGGKYKQNKLQIWYTKEKETADEVIERLVAELKGRRRQIYVATSDSIEQNVIFGHGALRMPARELRLYVSEGRGEVSKRLDTMGNSSRNTFDSKLNSEMRTLFEKWRRGDKDTK